jgi:HEAT repeat protein
MEQNSNTSPLPPDEDLTEVRKPASLLVVQFFLFPLIIIAICVGIFLFFGALTYQQTTAVQYLDKVASGSGKQRWQAAYELSTIIKKNPERASDPQFAERVIAAHRNSRDEDIPVRGYLALILGELKAAAAVPLLIEGLERDEKLKSLDWNKEGLLDFLGPSPTQIQELLIQNQINTLWALGSIGDNSAVPVALEYAKHKEASVRNVATYVLGTLKDERVLEQLRVSLNDSNDDVKLNAALALARMGNSEGADQLMRLLEPGSIDGRTDLTPEQKVEMKVRAITALGILRYEPAKEKIRAFELDSSLTVREAVLEALKKY